jgi:hypothetical protein
MNVDRKVGVGRLAIRSWEGVRESRVLLVDVRTAPMIFESPEEEK